MIHCLIRACFVLLRVAASRNIIAAQAIQAVIAPFTQHRIAQDEAADDIIAGSPLQGQGSGEADLRPIGEPQYLNPSRSVEFVAGAVLEMVVEGNAAGTIFQDDDQVPGSRYEPDIVSQQAPLQPKYVEAAAAPLVDRVESVTGAVDIGVIALVSLQRVIARIAIEQVIADACDKSVGTIPTEHAVVAACTGEEVN